MKIKTILIAGIAVADIALAGVLTGCYDEEPVGYAEVTSAPVDIDTYPSVMYDGQPAYFYGDHWWFRDGANWRYYRHEPAELHRQRGVVAHMPRRARVRAPIHEAPREEHR